MDYETLFYLVTGVALCNALVAWTLSRALARWRRIFDARLCAFDSYAGSLKIQRGCIEQASLKHWKRAKELEDELESSSEFLCGRIEELERELADTRARVSAADAARNYAESGKAVTRV